jgi:hypothetical protein
MAEWIESGQWKCESCGAVISPRETHICRIGQVAAYKSPPQPPYDVLRIEFVNGVRLRRAFKGNVEVDERTGRPLSNHTVAAPARKRGRSRKIRPEEIDHANGQGTAASGRW